MRQIVYKSSLKDNWNTLQKGKENWNRQEECLLKMYINFNKNWLQDVSQASRLHGVLLFHC